MTINFSWCAFPRVKVRLQAEKGYLAYPVERHISGVFKDIMIGMTQNLYVIVAWSSFRDQTVQDMFGMGRIACKGLRHLCS